MGYAVTLRRLLPYFLFTIFAISACSKAPVESFPQSISISAQSSPRENVQQFMLERYQMLDEAIAAYAEYRQKLRGGLDIGDELFELGHLIFLEQNKPTDVIINEYIQSNPQIQSATVAALVAGAKAAANKYHRSLVAVLDQKQLTNTAEFDRFTGAYQVAQNLGELGEGEFDELALDIKTAMLAADRADLWDVYSKMRFSKISEYQVSGQKPRLETVVGAALSRYMDAKAPAWREHTEWRLHAQILEQGFLAYPLLSVYSSLQDSGLNGYLGSSRLDGLDGQIRKALKAARED